MPSPWTWPWKEASGKDLIDQFLAEYKLLEIPVNAGWTASNVGSGATSAAPFALYVSTGTTASSRGMYYTPARGLNSGDIAYDYVDWTKRLELRLSLMRINSDAEAVARIQLKEAAAEGALAQRGMGLEIQNFSLLGEGYGTSRGTVSLGTLTNYRLARVRIVKTDTELQFWVNEVLQGRLTGDNVPNVQGTAAASLVLSIVNGPTGGVNAMLYVGDVKVIQKW